MLISLHCPECHRASVYHSRGRCRCGAYLVAAWAFADGHRFILPTGEQVWFWDMAERTWVKEPPRVTRLAEVRR